MGNSEQVPKLHNPSITNETYPIDETIKQQAYETEIKLLDPFPDEEE